MAENTKKWDETGRRYRSYIKLEKRLSENTVESYMRDYMQLYLIEILHQTTTSGLILIDKVLLTGCLPL